MAKKKTSSRQRSPSTKQGAKPRGKQARSRSTSNSAKSRSDSSKSSQQKPSTTAATPPTQPLTPPAWLKGKPIALSKWHELIEDLRERQLIVSIDLDLFALYCDAWQEFSEAEAGLKKSGRWFTTEKGYVAVHPAKLQRDKAVEQIQRLADRLGIGINKRRGLKVITPEENEDDGDPIATYAKKKPRKSTN